MSFSSFRCVPVTAVKGIVVVIVPSLDGVIAAQFFLDQKIRYLIGKIKTKQTSQANVYCSLTGSDWSVLFTA